MPPLRFGAYQYQNLPLDALRERWLEAERCDFDVMWNCDTVVDPDQPHHTMFDGPATLTLMAAETTRIRVGTLVSSLFAEFVDLFDRLLRQEVTTYQGTYYRCEGAETVPMPVQRPRPPLTVAAHGPKMLRIAARHADGWSSWGGYGVETGDDFFNVTARRCELFDDLCVGYGRDPATIRHSVVCFRP
jgi:alkanesulfonate monooxygenase SsuD/methylene tetrahydromethanopterin reductase-like flavin-dependent oxidoreductase (luciferase family)